MARRRYQMPDVERREGKRAYWRVRFRQDVLVGKGRVERKRRSKFLGYCPTTTDPEQRKARGEITKHEAERLRTKIMERVNSATQVVQSQIPVREFIAIWMDKHVSILGVATRLKYRTMVRAHILPNLGEAHLCDLDTEALQDMLNRKGKLSWWSKKTLLGVLSSIFTKAADWGYWHERNPVERVSAGKKRDARERRLLSLEDTEKLVAELPEYLKLLVAFLRTTGCRISEALGLQWKHLDLVNGWVRIEQRWYRGDLDEVKTERARRELPLGEMLAKFKALPRGDDVAYVFDRGDGRPWDDRTLMREHIRPIARKLGIYFPGLGFHSFRREVATRIQEAGASTAEAQLILGHTRAAMTGHYTLLQRERVKMLVERMQEQGSAEGGLVEFPEEKKA